MNGSVLNWGMIVIVSLSMPLAAAGGLGEERPEDVQDAAAQAQAFASEALGAGPGLPTEPPRDEPSDDGSGGNGGMNPDPEPRTCYRWFPVDLGFCPPEPPAAPEETPETPEPATAVPSDAELATLRVNKSPEAPSAPTAPSSTSLVARILGIIAPVSTAAAEAGASAKLVLQGVFGTAEAAAVILVEHISDKGGQADATVASLYEELEDLILGFDPAYGEATEHREQGALAMASDGHVMQTASATAAVAIAVMGGMGMLVFVFAAARRVLGFGTVALLSRIPSKDILKSETRSSILAIVESDPGVSLNEIVSRLGISRNAVAYHLAVFESESTIVSVKDGKYRRYFVNGGKYVNGAKDVVSAIKNDVTRNVVRFIMEHPGVMQKQVCEAIGTSPSATNWHITRLEKVGLVAKEKVANTVRYTPGPSFLKYDLAEFGLAQPVAA